MIAPQQEASVVDVSILADLSAIAKRVSSDATECNVALDDYIHKVEYLCGCINQERHPYLLDFLMILMDGVDQLIRLDRRISQSECDFLQKAPGVLSEYMLAPHDENTDKILLDLFRDPEWIRPITSDEALHMTEEVCADPAEDIYEASVELEDLLSDIDNDIIDTVTVEIIEPEILDIVVDVQTDPSSDTQESLCNLDPDQQELVDLIRVELEELIDHQYDPENDFRFGDHHQCERILNHMADRADNISNALELIGLEGLGRCGKFIVTNIAALLNTTDALDINKAFILKQWPVKLLKYLQNINDAESIAALLELLSNQSWAVQMDSAVYDQVKGLLENPVIIEEEREVRQVRASEEDVDLTLPDDVNQELLDGLLQDLPAQTEEFSTAIQNIVNGGGVENIDTAQRIAHTLKGAANVVGVAGIANLTHHLEDLLEAQAKSRTLPSAPLVSILIRAADCLESMAETLLGMNSPPDDAVSILQDVLDWANKQGGRVDHQQDSSDSGQADLMLAPEECISIDPADLESVMSADLPVKAAAHQMQTDSTDSGNTSLENMLRVPVSLADEMLRLAGENLIHTSQLSESIRVIARKQEALDLHNQSLLQLSYDLEHLIDIEGFKPISEALHSNDVFDSLEMDEYQEIHTISRRLVEIAADSLQFSRDLDKDLSGLNELVVDQDQLHKESEELVLRTRMIPVKTIVPRLKRGVRQACRLTGKQVALEVRDNNTLMDSEVLNSLIEPMMHILRNAIDHGVEDAEDRRTKGKPPEGTINLNFERKGNHIVIEIIDDGQGLNTDTIYSKALKLGMVDPADTLTTENIHKLILEPGFTTRSEVTQISGRGIGLDVVTVKIRSLKGSIDLTSNSGEGCRFSLSLPISSFSAHSLLVRCQQHIYAISSHGVEEILYPGIGEMRDVGDVTIFQLGQNAYNLTTIEALLSLPPDRRQVERNTQPILLVKDETGTLTAIIVEEVIDSRDVVVKSMGKYMPKLNGIIGATVLGDGSVSAVIDMPEMLRNRNNAMLGDNNKTRDIASQDQSVHMPYVLVVDDSLSARRSLAQYVEDMGFTVRTARDGMEAVNIIESSKPDLLLVDMEMPKMNGLELTSHVRASPEMSSTPVIMITSRSTDKHRKAAKDKGVSHFMVKPFDEDELALQINRMLEIA